MRKGPGALSDPSPKKPCPAEGTVHLRGAFLTGRPMELISMYWITSGESHGPVFFLWCLSQRSQHCLGTFARACMQLWVIVSTVSTPLTDTPQHASSWWRIGAALIFHNYQQECALSRNQWAFASCPGADKWVSQVSSSNGFSQDERARFSKHLSPQAQEGGADRTLVRTGPPSWITPPDHTTDTGPPAFRTRSRPRTPLVRPFHLSWSGGGHHFFVALLSHFINFSDASVITFLFVYNWT